MGRFVFPEGGRTHDAVGRSFVGFIPEKKFVQEHKASGLAYEITKLWCAREARTFVAFLIHDALVDWILRVARYSSDLFDGYSEGESVKRGKFRGKTCCCLVCCALRLTG